MAQYDGSRLISSSRQGLLHDAGAVLSAASQSLRAVGAFFVAHRQRTRQLQELHRFSDRELWDVGLSRSDISAIESRNYRRE
jgi:uncharacterized protein YjiS (DUF1127 family)